MTAKRTFGEGTFGSRDFGGEEQNEYGYRLGWLKIGVFQVNVGALPLGTKEA